MNRKLHDCGGKNGAVFTDNHWQIRCHVNKKNHPWYSLHRREHFLCFAYWSKAKKWGDYDSLLEYVCKWQHWHFTFPSKDETERVGETRSQEASAQEAS